MIFEKDVKQFVIKADGTVNEGLVAEDVKMKKEVKKPVEERNLPFICIC